MGALRMLRHSFAEGSARRKFSAPVLDAIQKAIAAGERRHSGQVMFAVEGALPALDLARGRSARDRAHEVFAHLRVWDTQHNSGVLVYVQLVDRRIEIVADRGIAAKVAQPEWDAICREMEAAFREGRFAEGALDAIGRCTALLARHFPSGGRRNRNELPDRPVLL